MYANLTISNPFNWQKSYQYQISKVIKIDTSLAYEKLRIFLRFLTNMRSRQNALDLTVLSQSDRLISLILLWNTSNAWALSTIRFESSKK